MSESPTSEDSSVAPSLTPNASRVMDEIFAQFSDDDDEFHTLKEDEINAVKKVLFADDSPNVIKTNVEEQQSSFTKNSNLNEVLSGKTIMSMEIEFEDGVIIPGADNLDDITNIETTENIFDDNAVTHINNNIENNVQIGQIVEIEANLENQDATVGVEAPRKVKKRPLDPDVWKQNIRKRSREMGEEYTDIKGNKHRKKVVEAACEVNCKFHCIKNIPENERIKIHEAFWKLSDVKKAHFYNQFVKRSLTVRKRTAKETSRRTFSYFYYLRRGETNYRVCKKFFLNTTSIGSQRIYYFFKKNLKESTNLPYTPAKGKNTKKVIPEEKKEEVRNHIKSFPVIESHYCRSNSTRHYLEASLNLSKMYRLYCLQTKNPVKFHLYQRIFNTEFNISFHKPKKDICDKCAEFRQKTRPSEEETFKYNEHIARKERGKTERDKDRNTKDEFTAFVTFDLQNVISLPKSNISSYFYKQKLNCYNLTAHCSSNKTVYCSIWHEGLCGRGGNHIACALLKILNQIAKDNPSLTRIVLWSDSCVPQNKNSIMSFALQTFLNSSSSINIVTIEQKFSEPGHGTIQEIDSAHSVIEKHIRFLDIFSPLSSIRAMLAIPEGKRKFKILQMTIGDYMDYQNGTQKLAYNQIPYNRVKHLLYNKNSRFEMSYKESFQENFVKINLQKNNKKIKDFPKPTKMTGSNFNEQLRSEKLNSLKSMLNTMPEEDRKFYENTILRESLKKPKQPKKKSKKSTLNETQQKIKSKKNK